MRSLALIPLLTLLTACPKDDPPATDPDLAMPDLAPAADMASSDQAPGDDTLGCDYRALGDHHDYCQDFSTPDSTVRAQLQRGCTEGKGTLLAGPCPHLRLGACRAEGVLGPIPITTTNWFASYPGVSTSEEMKTVCESTGATYVAP